MSDAVGFFDKSAKNKSAGRLIAMTLAAAAVGAFAAGLWIPDQGSYSLKAGVALILGAFIFYSGGKGLDVLQILVSSLWGPKWQSKPGSMP